MTASALRRLKWADMEKVEHRARVIYGRTGNDMPWAIVPQPVRDDFEARAAAELWDENALNFQPNDFTGEVAP